ncbi:MAG: metalloprotease [Candidatus Woesearchaeota archaeon]
MTYKQYSFKSRSGKFALHTSEKELKDLLIAWIFISIAFSIAQTVGDNFNINAFTSTAFLITIIISAITVGLAFLFHELAHKVVAQHYHCWAEFRADITMLILAVGTSFLGIIFLAPGAVMIFGHITEKQNGKISLAGPLTNIILALIIMPFLFITVQHSVWKEIISIGFLVNAWLALFNMIPFWNFDGAKIWRWSKSAYITMVVSAAFLLFIYFMRIQG